MGNITRSDLLFQPSSNVATAANNYKVTLSWSASTPNTVFTGCLASNATENNSWKGLVGNTPNSKLVDVDGSSIPVQYDLVCCKDGSTTCHKFNKAAEVVADSIYLHRQEMVAFSPLPATPKQNGLQAAAESSGDYTTTVNWKTEGITTGSCVASGPGVWSNWDGVVANNGSQQIIVRAVSPAVDTFTITCRGQYTDSMISDSFTINTTTPPNPGGKGVKLPSYIEN
jgi:hypothetical protein